MLFVSLVVNALWAGVVAYGIWRFAKVAEAFTPTALAAAKVAPPGEEIPEDLMALAASETETWAQEELVRVIQEKYDALKDWNRVRSAMGIGIRLEG